MQAELLSNVNHIQVRTDSVACFLTIVYMPSNATGLHSNNGTAFTEQLTTL